MDATNIEAGSDLDIATEELFAAWHKYRNFIKRHHRDRLAGVMWIRRGTELLCYSESERYTQQLCSLTFDAARDSFAAIDTY